MQLTGSLEFSRDALLHMKNISEIFAKDLCEIVEHLISLCGIEFKRELNHLSDPLIRWLDFRLRYIDPKPRQIIASDNFPKKLPETVETGFLALQQKIIFGEDINPFQSKSLIKFNDTSGKKKSKRTDLLWADWGVGHLHVTDKPIRSDSFFSERACSDGESWVLFFILDESSFGLIDIKDHNDESLFSENQIIETVARSWPQYMEQFRLKGIRPSREGLKASEISKLRAAGLTVPAIINGKAYIGPGLGISSAATSTKVTKKASEIRFWVQQLATIASDPSGQIQQSVRRFVAEDPSLRLYCSSEGLSIYEERSKMAFTILNESEPNNHSSKMHDLICPKWVRSKILSCALPSKKI